MPYYNVVVSILFSIIPIWPNITLYYPYITQGAVLGHAPNYQCQTINPISCEKWPKAWLLEVELAASGPKLKVIIIIRVLLLLLIMVV